MSVKCLVGLQNDDGSIEAVYVQNNGYIMRGVGELLQKNYNNELLVRDLLAHGEVQELNSIVETSVFNSKTQPKSASELVFSSIEEVFNLINENAKNPECKVFYIFNKEKGWQVASYITDSVYREVFNLCDFYHKNVNQEFQVSNALNIYEIGFIPFKDALINEIACLDPDYLEKGKYYALKKELLSESDIELLNTRKKQAAQAALGYFSEYISDWEQQNKIENELVEKQSIEMRTTVLEPNQIAVFIIGDLKRKFGLARDKIAVEFGKGDNFGNLEIDVKDPGVDKNELLDYLKKYQGTLISDPDNPERFLSFEKIKSVNLKDPLLEKVELFNKIKPDVAKIFDYHSIALTLKHSGDPAYSEFEIGNSESKNLSLVYNRKNNSFSIYNLTPGNARIRLYSTSLGTSSSGDADKFKENIGKLFTEMVMTDDFKLNSEFSPIADKLSFISVAEGPNQIFSQSDFESQSDESELEDFNDRANDDLTDDNLADSIVNYQVEQSEQSEQEKSVNLIVDPQIELISKHSEIPYVKENDSYIFIPEANSQLTELCNDKNCNLNQINTSKISDFSQVFYYSDRDNFSGIEKWDVSKGENFAFMFTNAKNFNADLSSWDTSNAKDMHSMFQGCSNFKGEFLGAWDVSGVKNMAMMFSGCENLCASAGASLKDWHVSECDNMANMFKGCRNFADDLSSWNLSEKAKGQIGSMFAKSAMENHPEFLPGFVKDSKETSSLSVKNSRKDETVKKKLALL